nr:hypothetical protein [Streptomyces sp. I5]
MGRRDDDHDLLDDALIDQVFGDRQGEGGLSGSRRGYHQEAAAGATVTAVVPLASFLLPLTQPEHVRHRPLPLLEIASGAECLPVGYVGRPATGPRSYVISVPARCQLLTACGAATVCREEQGDALCTVEGAAVIA